MAGLYRRFRRVTTAAWDWPDLGLPSDNRVPRRRRLLPRVRRCTATDVVAGKPRRRGATRNPFVLGVLQIYGTSDRPATFYLRHHP